MVIKEYEIRGIIFFTLFSYLLSMETSQEVQRNA